MHVLLCVSVRACVHACVRACVHDCMHSPMFAVPKTAATLSMGEFIYDTPVFESTTNSTEYHEMLFELPADTAPKTPKGSDVQVDGNVQEDSSSDKTLNVVLHSKSAQGPIIAMGTISLGDLLEDAPVRKWILRMCSATVVLRLSWLRCKFSTLTNIWCLRVIRDQTMFLKAPVCICAIT